MKNLPKLAKYLAIPMLLAACSTTPRTYQAESPKMDFITYFSGTTHGYGAIFSRTGKVTDRFHMVATGTPATGPQGQRTLQLVQTISFTSGKTQHREEVFTETAPNRLQVQGPDLSGAMSGEQVGNAAHFTYKIDIPRDGSKTITLGSSDWLWMLPGNVALNRNSLSKFGIKVAEMVITFTKQPPAKS